MASHPALNSSRRGHSDEETEQQERPDGDRFRRTLKSTIVCVSADPDSPVDRAEFGNSQERTRAESDNSDKKYGGSSQCDGERERVLLTRVSSKEWDRDREHVSGKEVESAQNEQLPRILENDSSELRVWEALKQRDIQDGDRKRDRDDGVQREIQDGFRKRDRDDGATKDFNKREVERHVGEEPERPGGDEERRQEKRTGGDTVSVSQSRRERGWERDGIAYEKHSRGHQLDQSRRDIEEIMYRNEERDAGNTVKFLPAVDRHSKGKDLRGEKRKETDRGRDRERGDGSSVPELYTIHRATVHSVRPFGLFVRMEGYRQHGLVHLSQVSDHEVTKRDDPDGKKVEALSSVAGEGEKVWVKVISIKTDEGGVKVGCSLKYVSQGDGRDLDPNNLLLEKLQTKPAWQPPQKLQLDAVYNVTCTRCGGHGHLKKECYSTGEKIYDLLQEGDDNAAQPSSKARSIAKLLPEMSSGASRLQPPSGPAGRGRAMVQPAWMKHGIGVGGDVDKGLGRSTSGESGASLKGELPEKVTTVQEALAVIARLKEEKSRRREDKRRDRKHLKKERKNRGLDSGKERHRKRHRSEDGHRSRKKYKV